MNKLIINLTPTGMVPTRAMNPHVPLSPEEIARDVDACVAMGVSMVHLHARDPQGLPAWRKETYADSIARIRARHPGLTLVVSTSGRVCPGFPERSDVLDLEGPLKPDMASLTLGSMNFQQGASVNGPELIRALAARMRERGIKPELEVFDLGMVNYAHYLIRKGLLTPPYYFNLILGSIASAQARLSHLGLLVAELPPDSLWSVGALGESQLPMNAVGVACAHGVRVGLEDNLFMDEDRARPASNPELVARVRALADAQGRPVASIQETRAMLGLQEQAAFHMPR